MSDIFDRSATKFALLGALIMSMQDGELDDAEFGVVNAFAAKHWNPEYGERGKMIEEVIHYKGQIFTAEESRIERVKKLSEILKGQFNDVQKEAFLEFIQEVMIADGIEETAEVDFLDLFSKALRE